MADYKSMYYHLAGRMAVAVDTMDVVVTTLEATTKSLQSAANSLQTTAESLAKLTEKLKLAQQATEEMFISCEDDDGENDG